MGVYINMGMPNKCYDCRFKHYEGHGVFVCKAMMKTLYDDDEVFKPWKRRMENCPLVPVPKHGRLIDADALCELCDIMADKCDGVGESIWHQFRTTVEWTPTIVLAEEGE